MKNKIYLFIALFALLAIVAFKGTATAYDPPIGIPNPSWGSIHPIDITAPSWPTGWPASEVAGYYYIDNNHGSATDSGNTYGYPNRPRMTIPEVTYAAGSYVEIKGGPYTDNAIQLEFNGTETNPCWFRGTSTNMPIIVGTMNVKDSSFVIMEYLDFNGGSSTGLSVNGNGDHLCIRNSQFRNKTWVANRSGIGILPDTGDTIHDVVIYNNNFEELGTWNTEIDQDFHGVGPSLWGRDSSTEEYNIWILENTFYHISGNGVQVNAGNWEESYKYLHHIYIGNNNAHALRQAGFWSKQASDVIMSQNTVYDNRDHGPQPGDCFGYQYRPNNLWIIFNTCYDSNYGVRQSSTSGWGIATNKSYIIGNSFYNLHPVNPGSYSATDYWRKGVAISLWTGDMNRYIVDNTIHDCYNGINMIQTGEGSYAYVSGNVISDIDPNSYHLSIHMNVDQDVDVVNCDLYDPSHDARVRWDGTTYTSLSSFQSATDECANCLEVEPLFVNASGNDFHIQKTSLLKDAGIVTSVYSTFYSLYGIDIKKSADGTIRPKGDGWDIGAYESGGISNPKGLQIIK